MQSLERTLASFVPHISAFICFFVLSWSESTKLTTAKIFSTVELMGTLALYSAYFGISIGFYF